MNPFLAAAFLSATALHSGRAAPPTFSVAVPDSAADAALAQRVEVVRTRYGVPHLLADDPEAMGFGMGYVQTQDYGARVPRSLLKSRGTYARYVGHDSIEGDFESREAFARAVTTFSRLDPATQAVYRGFAAGVNHYVRLHRAEFPEWIRPDFTGYDALARDVQTWSRSDAERFRAALEKRDPPPPPQEDPEDGSNAWAFAPERSASGHAMLLRNPHLRWDAGYYEAHVRVPGVLDFYGDFRIGGPFGIIGGFNRRLGWSTTNNYPRYSQVYALEADPNSPDRFILDGLSHPLEERRTTVDYRRADGSLASETRSTLWTPYGPVIARREGVIYILKDPRDGAFRRGEQFLRMMRASNLEEWLEVMRMRAHPSSNFTYADADGNILYLWNARVPLLPHAPTGDTAAVAHRVDDMWRELVPFDDLPRILNPPGGYLQQANDTPDYTNLRVPFDRDTLPANLPPRRLRLRSQLSLDLVDNDRVLSLEEMIRLKHTPRMLLAERVVDELAAAVRAAAPSASVRRALDALEAWDRTAGAGSRGGVLFETWSRRYTQLADTAHLFDVKWSPERPTDTPRGIGSVDDAVAAFHWAVAELERRRVPLDVSWGEIHRVRVGRVDAPVSGCPALLGCFRVLSYREDDDGKLSAFRGDGWVLAVEFAAVPHAYSVLAYGESSREDSPHHDDQAAMFAAGRMKPVAFTDEDIARTTIARYHPGEEVRR